MIDRDHQLPITRQAQLLDISRGSVYYLPRPVSDADLALMRRIDELHLAHPFMGARMLRDQLQREGIKVNIFFHHAGCEGSGDGQSHTLHAFLAKRYTREFNPA